MKNWIQCLAKINFTIRDVLELLNSTGMKVVVIVDDELKILGTVSDGDIRRGLLRGVRIEDLAKSVMNSNPTTMLASSTKKDIQKRMTEKAITLIPLVDASNKIIDIVSADDLSRVEKKENHVVLMAGGLGSRLASLTSNCPKPMLKIGGRPILETIIETIKEHGFYKVTIAVNHMSEMIENYFGNGSKLGVEINYIKENQRLGTAGALSLFSPSNSQPFIVMNGDLLTKINFSDLLSFHIKSNSSATMCLRQYEHQIPFGVVSTENDQITKIEEKPILSFFVNGGIYILNREALQHLPKDTYSDMPTFLENLIEKNHHVGAYPFFEYWRDIGRVDDFEKAHMEFLEVFK